MKFFYEYFRPIAVCFKILGLLPLENLLDTDPSQIRFRALSFSFLYSTASLVLILGLLFYYIGGVLQQNITGILRYVIYVMGARSLLSFLLYSCRSYYELPKLIQLLDMFDRKKVEIVKLKEAEWKRRMKWTIIPVACMLLALGCYIVTSAGLISTVYPNIPNRHSKYLYSFLINWQLFPAFLYLYFARKIQEGFLEVNNALLEATGCFKYEDKDFTKSSIDIYNTISKIRILHNILNDGAYQMGKAFGLFMAIDKLTIILVLILNIVVYVTMNDHNINLLWITVFNGILVVFIIWSSQKIKENVSIFL